MRYDSWLNAKRYTLLLTIEIDEIILTIGAFFVIYNIMLVVVNSNISTTTINMTVKIFR